jgi:hypothetical protein
MSSAIHIPDPSTLLAKSMTGILPNFEVASKDISILATPTDFYKDLLVSAPIIFVSNCSHRLQTMIARAKRRIHLSSLYIGETETQLVRLFTEAKGFYLNT